MWDIINAVKNLFTPKSTSLISPLAKTQSLTNLQGPMSTGVNQFAFPSQQQAFNPLQNVTRNTTTTPPPTSNASGPGSVKLNLPSTVPTQFQQPSTPTFNEGPGDTELEAMYGGARSALDTQQASLEKQLPLLLSQLATQKQDLLDPYTQKETEGLQTLAGNETETRQQEQNALAQARQLYNELAQYNQARFGGGTSAGQGALELLGRETQKQFGGITQTAGQNMQKIEDARKNLKDFVFTAKQSIEKQVADKVTAAQNWFQDQLNQVNTNRSMLESDKAAKRYQVLQQRQNFANQVAQQQWEYQTQLANWYQQQMVSLAAQAQNYQVQTADPTAIIQQLLAGNTNMEATAPGSTGATITGGTTTGGGYTASTRYVKGANGLWEDTLNPGNYYITPPTA